MVSVMVWEGGAAEMKDWIGEVESEKMREEREKGRKDNEWSQVSRKVDRVEVKSVVSKGIALDLFLFSVFIPTSD